MTEAQSISIHALLAESDRFHAADMSVKRISIHALLAESDLAISAVLELVPISIHALLAESDARIIDPTYGRGGISIHALLAESGDTVVSMIFRVIYEDFYPRSPCGERRYMSLADRQASLFLSTLSPCGERLKKCGDGEPHVNFYPRSPCGERLLFQGSAKQIFHFYPRSPCGERRRPHHGNSRRLVISIHALLAESDLYSQHVTRPSEYFYPRSPCGERLKKILPPPGSRSTIFLSTLSLAESDLIIHSTSPGHQSISIHALLAESDNKSAV